MVPLDVLAQAYDDLANDGAAHGVRIAFENTPFSLHVKSTVQAVDFVKYVGNPNGGLILDIWHAYLGGTRYPQIADITPLEYVFGVELDDGHADVVGTDLEDTFDNRVPCGTGVFDVPGFIDAARKIGYEGPWGIEHMSRRHRGLPIDAALTQARYAAPKCFELADQADSTKEL